MLDSEENVIVVVRVRPIQKSEESKGETSCVESISNGREVQVRTGPLAAEVYKCNGCFPRETTQVSSTCHYGPTCRLLLLFPLRIYKCHY